MFLYHITRESDWLKARETGVYTSPTLSSEGFIHCSLRLQVADTAGRYFHGIQGLVLLEIDPQLLSSHWVLEPSTGEELFPHVYGGIDLAAVKRVVALNPQPDGNFIFPVELD